MMDTAFFVMSKLVGATLKGETWIIVLLGLGMIAHRRARPRQAGLLTGVAFALLLTLTVLPLGDMLIRPIEARYPVAPDLRRVDGIIVLGGAEQAGNASYWGLPQVNEAAERYTEAVALALAHPGARLLLSGGSGALADLGRTGAPQSRMAKDLVVSLGIPADRVLLEGTSRNTAENARNSLALIKPKAGEVWVLVTSAYHMPRAMRSFQAAGWTGVVAWPVDHRAFPGFGVSWNLPRNLRLVNTAVKEIFGQLAYDLTGR
ncbi:YdcF family protein [Thalassovita sp.]|uniref:YdcF family protein n=1 Tax=Thalassovita sp. TaxID=1979401 RepID=UPI0029DE6DD6|nr:YdcF family protein [Thalassovita sp.]